MNNNASKPICLIKRDRNHLIKNVCQWTCFEKEEWHVKDFYVRVIGYCLEINDLSLLEETLRDIIVVCNSDTINIGTESFNSCERLIHKIKTFNYDTPKEKSGMRHKTEETIETSSNNYFEII